MDCIRSKVKDKVLSFIDEKRLFADIDSIVVGFSGGPDSTMLLVLIHEVVKDVKAVHLHHGLRGSVADRDERWCKNFCERRSIPYESSHLNIPVNKAKGESAEVASRRLRLEYWANFLAYRPRTALALGHHFDDKIENFFIRLLRGSNTTGLTGLRPLAIVNGVKTVRPLLGLEKKEILCYLKECNIRDYCIDESNTNQRILRNKIRHYLVPEVLKIAGNKNGLAKSLDFIEQDALTLENRIRESIDNLPNGKLPTDTLFKIPSSMWSRFLRGWMQIKYGRNPPLRGSMIRNLQANLRHPISNTKRFEIDKDHFLSINPDNVSLEKKQFSTLSDEIKWEWKKNSNLVISEINIELIASIVNYSDCLNNFSDPNVEYWDPQALNDYLIIRPRRPGDVMIPFGVTHPVRLKKIIGNAKLTTAQKHRLIIIANTNGEILWVPFMRRAAFGKVRKSKCVCVKLTVQNL